MEEGKKERKKKQKKKCGKDTGGRINENTTADTGEKTERRKGPRERGKQECEVAEDEEWREGFKE